MINKIYIPGRLLIKIDGTRYFKPDDNSILQKYLQETMQGDPEVLVELNIVRQDNKKSAQQLRYFYGVVLPVLKQALEELQGESLSKEEVIMFLKDRFFYEEIPTGEHFIKLPMSFSKAKKSEIYKFIQDVIDFGRDILNVEIPEPIKDYGKQDD